MHTVGRYRYLGIYLDYFVPLRVEYIEDLTELENQFAILREQLYR